MLNTLSLQGSKELPEPENTYQKTNKQAKKKKKTSLTKI